eukprot:49597_1
MTYQSLKMKLFIWLSITVDVISFFFIISYAFHTPDTNNLKYYFKNIQTIYFYQFAITFLPLSVVLFIGFHLQITLGASFHKDCKCWIFRFFMWSLVFLIGVSIVLFVVLLLLQIFCASWILVMLVILGSIDKLPYQPYTIDSHKFYSKWIRWIVDECKDITDNNGNILLSSKQDMLIRLCLFNKIIMEETSSSYSMTIKDKKLISYLQIEQATYFKHVTFNSIRQNCTDVIDPEKLDNTGNEKPAPFWKAFWYSFYSWYLIEQKHNIKHDYFDGDFPVDRRLKRDQRMERWTTYVSVVTLSFICYIGGPMYFIWKLMNLLMPLFVIFYFGINLFIQINSFQIVIWFIYVSI